MERFGFGIPAVIEAIDEVPSRAVRIVGRQEVQVREKRSRHLVQLAHCPVDCIFEEEDEIMAPRYAARKPREQFVKVIPLVSIPESKKPIQKERIRVAVAAA